MATLTDPRRRPRRLPLYGLLGLPFFPVMAVVANNALARLTTRQIRPTFQLLPGGPTAKSDVVFVAFHGLWSRDWGSILHLLQSNGAVLLASNGANVQDTPAATLAELERLKLLNHQISVISFSLGTQTTMQFKRLFEQQTGRTLNRVILNGGMRGPEYVIWPHWSVRYAVQLLHGGPIVEYIWRQHARSQARRMAGKSEEELRRAQERERFHSHTVLTGARLLIRGVSIRRNEFRLPTRVLVIHQVEDPRVHLHFWEDVAPHADIALIQTPGHVAFDTCPEYLNIIEQWLSAEPISSAAA